MTDPSVHGFVLDGSLHKLMRNGPVLIDPIGPTEDKLEREFFQPSGRKLIMEMENKGI